LTVFEQNDHVGGHTNTVRVDAADGVHNVDTGFVVFNEERYPSFARLLEKLGVESQASSMSFSVHSEVDGLEYSNRSLLAQRRNALRPAFWRMIADIVRFNRSSRELLLAADDEVRLGPFLEVDAAAFERRARLRERQASAGDPGASPGGALLGPADHVREHAPRLGRHDGAADVAPDLLRRDGALPPYSRAGGRYGRVAHRM